MLLSKLPPEILQQTCLLLQRSDVITLCHTIQINHIIKCPCRICITKEYKKGKKLVQKIDDLNNQIDVLTELLDIMKEEGETKKL